jgi:hypothetical protein
MHLASEHMRGYMPQAFSQFPLARNRPMLQPYIDEHQQLLAIAEACYDHLYPAWNDKQRASPEPEADTRVLENAPISSISGLYWLALSCPIDFYNCGFDIAELGIRAARAMIDWHDWRLGRITDARALNVSRADRKFFRAMERRSSANPAASSEMPAAVVLVAQATNMQIGERGRMFFRGLTLGDSAEPGQDLPSRAASQQRHLIPRYWASQPGQCVRRPKALVLM